MFVDPPEVNMFWPEVLGGGYHYMMINGKWNDTTGVNMPFNFHLGIGQLYRGNTYNVDSIYAFVQNYFTVSLPGSAFTIADKDTATFRLTMNIENWFENPHVFDFNQWGGAIMQNQPAMQIVKENGWDVFSITASTERSIIQCHDPAFCEIKKFILFGYNDPWTQVFRLITGYFHASRTGHHNNLLCCQLIKKFMQRGENP